MARFSFGKRTQESEEIPPEPVEGEVEVSPQEEQPSEGGSRSRRPLILVGIGVVLAGGLYLANSLFFSAPPPPPPARQPAPVPAPPVAKAPAPAKEAAPAPPAPATPAPAKAEAKAFQAPSEPAKPTPPAKAVPEPAPAAKPTATAKAAPAEPQPAKPAPPAPKPEAKTPGKVSPATGGFSVQVGAMAMEENAERLKQKLEAMGYPAVIRKGAGYTNRHLVTAGEPTGKREAEDLARRLNVDGFPSQLISLEGKYAPQVGAFVSLDEAIDLARELQKKNYRPKITSKPATAVLYQVRTGQFDTRAAATKRGEELKGKGFSAWVVPN